MNDELKEIIRYAMYRCEINKRELSEYMSMSYPTMLSKLKKPDSLKISEARRLCGILNLDLNHILTINK